MKTGEVSKLVTLRAKTDSDLIVLVESELKRALAMASLASTRKSPLYVDAQKIHRTVTKLLPTISSLERSQREALEAVVKELRLALASVTPIQRQAACSAALAD